MAERFYVNNPLGLGPVTVEGPEAHHLSAVCRARPGDEVTLFNGDGREYRAAVTTVSRRQVELRVLDASAPDRELAFRLVFACPLPKGDRGQGLVEKLTELGVTTYVPLRTQRSVVHPGEGKSERLRRWVIEASKQCGRNVLMQVGDLTPWEDLLRDAALPRRRFVADFSGAPWRLEDRAEDTVVAIGPEGGFTVEETAGAREADWQVVRLGPRVLRVETAACTLAALVGVQRDL